MTALLRALLGFVGAVSMLGAVWFFDSAGSYPGLLGGIAMVIWALLWNSTGKIQFVSLTSLVLSVVATGWMATMRLATDPEAAPTALLLVLISVACAAVWVRQRSWL